MIHGGKTLRTKIRCGQSAGSREAQPQAARSRSSARQSRADSESHEEEARRSLQSDNVGRARSRTRSQQEAAPRRSPAADLRRHRPSSAHAAGPRQDDVRGCRPAHRRPAGPGTGGAVGRGRSHRSTREPSNGAERDAVVDPSSDAERDADDDAVQQQPPSHGRHSRRGASASAIARGGSARDSDDSALFGSKARGSDSDSSSPSLSVSQFRRSASFSGLYRARASDNSALFGSQQRCDTDDSSATLPIGARASDTDDSTKLEDGASGRGSAARPAVAQGHRETSVTACHRRINGKQVSRRVIGTAHQRRITGKQGSATHSGVRRSGQGINYPLVCDIRFITALVRFWACVWAELSKQAVCDKSIQAPELSLHYPLSDFGSLLTSTDFSLNVFPRDGSRAT